MDAKSYTEAAEQSKRFFGDWVSNLLRIGSIIAAIATAVYFGVEFANNLSGPYLRWMLEASGLVLFLGAFLTRGSRRSDRLLLSDGSAATLTKPRWPYGCGALVCSALLIADLGVVLGGKSHILEVGEVSLVSGFIEAEGEMLIGQGDFIHESERWVVCEGSDDALKGLIDRQIMGLRFPVRKRDHVDELVIEDIEITVHSYKVLPPRAREVYSPHPIEPDAILFVDMKSSHAALPWTMRVDRAFDGKGPLVTWGLAQYVLRDNFQKRIRIQLVDQSPGVFCFTADLLVRSGVGPAQRIPLSSEELVFVGVGRGENKMAGEP